MSQNQSFIAVLKPDGNLSIVDFEVNHFKDQDAPSWLKISGIGIYSLQVCGSAILITFVYFERKGSFGHHRSVLSQINSWLYVMIGLYCVITVGIDLFRLILGPLPDLLCDWNSILKNTLVLTGTFLNVVIAFLKFMFICVWKSYRHMYHKIITTFVGTASLMISFLMSITFTFGPGKTTLYKSICTASFQPSENLLGPRIATPRATLVGLVVYICFMIPISIRRFMYQRTDARGTKKSPKVDLICLTFNLTYSILAASTTLTIWNMNRHRAKGNEDFDVASVWMHLMYIYFIVPLSLIVIMVSKMFYKHGKRIFKKQ